MEDTSGNSNGSTFNSNGGPQNNYGVPFEDYRKLGDIAKQYKELLLRLKSVQFADPEVQRLKKEAGQAIEAGDYAKAEELLNQADARDVQAIEQLEDAARQRRISAAASNADNARLQRIQLRYAKAAAYWRTAAERLPHDQKQKRALYLHSAGYDFYRVTSYSEALPLYEQSLSISQEIGDKAGEGATLSNIGAIHYAQGDYAIALKYLDQSLSISQEIGDKAEAVPAHLTREPPRHLSLKRRGTYRQQPEAPLSKTLRNLCPADKGSCIQLPKATPKISKEYLDSHALPS